MTAENAAKDQLFFAYKNIHLSERYNLPFQNMCSLDICMYMYSACDENHFFVSNIVLSQDFLIDSHQE